MLAGRKYRLEFDFGQRLFAERLGGICRSVWNTGLEQRRAYRRRGAFIGYAEQCRQLAEAKTDPDCAWLAEAPAQVIQQTLKDQGAGKTELHPPELRQEHPPPFAVDPLDGLGGGEPK